MLISTDRNGSRFAIELAWRHFAQHRSFTSYVIQLISNHLFVSLSLSLTHTHARAHAYTLLAIYRFLCEWDTELLTVFFPLPDPLIRVSRAVGDARKGHGRLRCQMDAPQQTIKMRSRFMTHAYSTSIDLLQLKLAMPRDRFQPRHSRTIPPPKASYNTVIRWCADLTVCGASKSTKTRRPNRNFTLNYIIFLEGSRPKHNQHNWRNFFSRRKCICLPSGDPPRKSLVHHVVTQSKPSRRTN